MPTYEFIGPAGEVVERVYSMKDCPDSIRVGKKKYQRAAFSRGNTTVFSPEQVAATAHGYPRVDVTLPKEDLGGGQSPSGHVIIKSQAHEREIVSRFNGGSGSSRMHRD